MNQLLYIYIKTIPIKSITMSSNKCFNHRFNKWTELIAPHKSIVDYFGLSNETIHMDLSRVPDTNICVFTFCYTSTPQYIFGTVPHEISNRIYEYYNEYLIFQFKVEYGEKYPFRPPKWSLYSYTYTFTTAYDKRKTDQVVKAYCNGMASCHNRQYKENWSPVIMIHTDVLAFYMVISDFRGLIHKLRSPTSFDMHL